MRLFLTRELGIVQMQNPRGRKEAEQSLRKAVHMQPTDPRALSHLGLLYKKKGLAQQAEDLFERALEWDSENAVALAGLGSLQNEPQQEGERGLLKGLFRRR